MPSDATIPDATKVSASPTLKQITSTMRARSPGIAAAVRVPMAVMRVGMREKAEGSFTAKFAGTHGWFWRNRTSQPITVTVKTTGRYEKLER